MTKLLKTKYIALLLAAGALGACGTSSGGNNGIAIDLSTTRAIDATNFSLLAAIGEPPTPIQTSAIPTQGTSSYNGTIRIDAFTNPTPPTEPAYVGETTINVSFAGSTSVTGTADNFVFVGGDEAPDDPLTPLGGSLQITGGTIDRMAGMNDPQFEAGLSGTLIIPTSINGTGSPSDVDITGDIGGFFLVGGIAADFVGTLEEGANTEATEGVIIAVEN